MALTASGREESTMAQRGSIVAAVGGAVAVGAMTAVQTRVNGSLGAALNDGVLAGAVSFGSGLVVVLAIALVLPAGRRGIGRLLAGVRARSIPVWMLLGGAAGAFTVASQGLTVGAIGVALFTVGFVAGQTGGGLALDRAGYGPAGVVAVTRPRLIGALLAIAGVGVCLADGAVGSVPLWMILIPVVAGAGVSWQQGTNGRLRVRVDSPLTATLVNFLGGTIVLIAAAAIHIGFAGPPRALPTDPWLYLGGTIGVVYIFLSAQIVRRTGVLLLGLGSVTGLLSTSVVLDAFWPAPAAPSTPIALLAAGIALLGVAVAAVPWRHRTR
ncbi:DMT family transporter [Microbacterium testaceum]|uniref:DMT family transporter n=1 Tax=Microbacterium testaceum TaxID=2033 RepID=UPI00343748D2